MKVLVALLMCALAVSAAPSEIKATAAAEPAPTEATPTEPTPSEGAPTEPTPSEGAPSDPVLAQSVPSYSAPSYSAPSYSAPSYSMPSYSGPTYFDVEDHDSDSRHHVQHAAISRDEERLLDAVSSNDLDSAVTYAKKLEGESKGDLIEDAVTRLIRDSSANLLNFAYKLWNGSGKDIVRDYFPAVFRQILSENSVRLTFIRDNLALKLGVARDSDDDRIAYGDANDKSSDNIKWKFDALWESNKVYFKLSHPLRHQYLKLGTGTDGRGDHSGFGDFNANSHRHQWYLRPTFYENRPAFYIVSRQYEQALKLGRSVDRDGDRRVYSHNGDVTGRPDLYGWTISH